MENQEKELPPGMQPEPEKKHGMFGGHDKGEQKMTQLNDKVTAFSIRIKELEERYVNLRKRTNLTDQNMIANHKKNNTEFKTINSEINEVKQEINDIKEKMNLIVKELKMTASKEEVHVLEKYINLWEPVNFVTQKEVQKLVDEAIEKRLSK